MTPESRTIAVHEVMSDGHLWVGFPWFDWSLETIKARFADTPIEWKHAVYGEITDRLLFEECLRDISRLVGLSYARHVDPLPMLVKVRAILDHVPADMREVTVQPTSEMYY